MNATTDSACLPIPTTRLARIPQRMLRACTTLALCLAPLLAQAGPTTGASLWLKADAGVTVDGSGKVIDWTDQSGNSHDAFQSDALLRPTFVFGGLNGLPVIRFNGVDTFLDVAGSLLTSSQFTIIAVVNDTRAANDDFPREIISNWDGTNTVTSVFLGTIMPLGDPDHVRLTDYFGGATDPNGNNAGVGDLTDPASHFILTGVSGATNAFVYQNSTELAALGEAITPRDLTTPWRVGTQGGPFEIWNGDIAEILVYDFALSSSQLAETWGYLDEKYFATSAVPEPSSMLLLTLGASGLVFMRRRKSR